jgi:hypothetical protein
MREPIGKRDAAAEESYAIAMAKRALWSMIHRFNLEEKNPAEADYYHARDLITRILNHPGVGPVIREIAPGPNARDWILSRNQSGRPPLRPNAGRRTNMLRERWIADIIESIRILGFKKTRNDATRENAARESAASIVATAWSKLKSEFETNYQELRAVLIEQGFTPLQADLRIQGLRGELSYGLEPGAKGLSESTLQRIYKKSLWNKRAESLRAVAIEQGFTPEQAEIRIQSLIRGPRKALSEGSHQQIYVGQTRPIPATKSLLTVGIFYIFVRR